LKTRDSKGWRLLNAILHQSGGEWLAIAVEKKRKRYIRLWTSTEDTSSAEDTRCSAQCSDSTGFWRYQSALTFVRELHQAA